MRWPWLWLGLGMGLSLVTPGLLRQPVGAGSCKTLRPRRYPTGKWTSKPQWKASLAWSERCEPAREWSWTASCITAGTQQRVLTSRRPSGTSSGGPSCTPPCNELYRMGQATRHQSSQMLPANHRTLTADRSPWIPRTKVGSTPPCPRQSLIGDGTWSWPSPSDSTHAAGRL